MTLILAACHDKPRDAHVFASPPPRRPPAPPVAAAPDLPLGSKGPGAVVVSVLDSATGTPVSLTAATGTLEVLTLSALGPGDWSSTGNAHVDLAVLGRRDTVLTHPLGA